MVMQLVQQEADDGNTKVLPLAEIVKVNAPGSS